MKMATAPTEYLLDATYYRTALLLGLVRASTVHQWVEQVIARDPRPPVAFFEVASIAGENLSALRHALWPLVEEPDPPAVVERLLAPVHRSGRGSAQPGGYVDRAAADAQHAAAAAADL